MRSLLLLLALAVPAKAGVMTTGNNTRTVVADLSGQTITPSTIVVLQDGTNANQASIYPNAPLVMLGNANSYLQAVIQNLNNGTLAQSALVLTGDLGTDTSYYFNLQKSNSRFSNSSYAVFPASSAVMYDSDSPIYIWADTNGSQYGGSGHVIIGSSIAVSGNTAMDISSRVVNVSAQTGLAVTYGVTAGSGTIGVPVNAPATNAFRVYQNSGKGQEVFECGASNQVCGWSFLNDAGNISNNTSWGHATGNTAQGDYGIMQATDAFISPFNTNAGYYRMYMTRDTIGQQSGGGVVFGNNSTLATNAGFQVGGSSLVILQNGKIGIGTTLPATLLHMSSGILTIDGTNSAINVAASNTQSSFGQMISTGSAFPQFTIAPGQNSNVAGGMIIRDGAAAATSRDYQLSTTDQAVGDFSLKAASIKGASLNTLVQNWTSSQTYIRSGMNLGIGATAPSAALHINNSIAATGYSIKITSSDASVNFGVQGNGVIVSSSAVPTVSCNAGTGAMSADSTNNWGSFTAGSAAANCTVTFSGAGWPNNARCVIVDDTSLVAVRVSAQSKTAFTAAGTTISNDVIQYICGGN